MSTRTTSVCWAVAALVALVPAGAFASGFSIYEQGGKASGVAGAFTALADDASANWYNPAALVWMEGRQFQAGINLITAGGDTELDVLDPNFGVFTPTTFEPESSIETPVHFYYTHKVNSNIAWGLGVTTPFGLVTDWQVRPITFSARKSELTTFVVNPNVAFRMTETWSVAVGVDYIFADVGEFSREVPIDLDGNPLNGFEVIGSSNLSGDGDDIGWNVAISRRTATSAFGLSYRSDLSPDIDGQIDYANFGPLTPFFPSSPGSTTVNLPAQAAIGWAFQVGRKTWVEVDVAWAEWSAFESIDVDIDNETNLSRDFIIEENWDDTFSYRVGVFWETSPTAEWRFGAVLDESPVPEEFLRPSIPDAERTGFTLGYGHTGNKWNVDAYYMALFFDDITALPLNEGVVAGTYETFVHLAGVSLNYKF
ncbi:MAG: outer membrane protein transport protein [Acidobacteriota bacterium]